MTSSLCGKKNKIELPKKSLICGLNIRQEILNINSINYNITQFVESEMNGDISCAPLKLKTVSTKITNSNTIHRIILILLLIDLMKNLIYGILTNNG